MTWARRKATGFAVALQLACAATLVAVSLSSFAAAPVLAQTPSVEQLFPARPTGFVTDVAGLIDPATKANLEDLIQRLHGVTGAEIAVVTLPTIGDRDAAEVALAIGRKWGVGARANIGDPTRNAGAVVLLVPRQEGRPGSGHLRIEVGQGLEGIVTDAGANQVFRRVMQPYLAQEQYGQGLLHGVQALVGIIARGYGVSDSTLTAYAPPTGREERPVVVSWLPLVLFLIFVMLASRGGRRRRRGVYWGGPWIGGGGGGFGGYSGGGGGFGGFGGFGGGGGFSGGGSGGRF